MYFVVDLKIGDVYYVKDVVGYVVNIKKVLKYNEVVEK